ncbi:hypothetical protein KUTeg_007872 [Tegillarca granosa]|uniref:BIRC2_3 n=1 Tax=Tegillarca granosa TaxID=220873 RepID=A0ABQ9FGR3_TEGGR|nr:hypothetical protein KUTeg_007872 [Tegillarca granosa]
MENYILILLLVTSGICFVDCHFGIARKLLETFNICRDVQNLKTYQALLMKLRESRLSIIMNSYMIYNRSNNSYSKRLFNGFLLKNASFASSDISEARTCNDTIVAESILHKHGDFNIHTNVDVTNDTCCHDIFQLSKMFESMHFPISFIGLMCLCFQLCFHPCFQTFADLLQSFCGLNIGTGKTNLTLQIQKIIHEKQNKYFSKFFSKLCDLCNRDMIDSLLKKELSPRPQQSMEDENLDQEGNSFGHKRTYYPCRRCFRMLTAKRLFQQNRNEIFGLFPEPKHKNIHDLYYQGFCEVTYQIQASRQTLCDSLKLFISRALLFSDLYNTLDIVAANAYQAKTLPIPLKSNHIIHEQLNAAESAVVEEAEITSSLEKTSGNKKEDREKSDDLLSAIRGTDVSAWARDNVTLYPVYKQTLDSFFKQSVEENLGNNSNAYKFEMIRLATFSNFGAHIPASSVSLAKAGFYATGSSNECKCFSCGISYSNWREWDNPFDIHRQISPSCSFINGTETDNICIQKHGDSTSSGNGNSNMGCNGISETTSSITENLQSANTVLQNGSMNTSEQPAVNQLNQSHTREHAIGNLNNTEETTRVRTPQMPSRNIPDLANSNERSESTRMSEQQRRKQTDNAQSGSRSANHDKYNQLGINFDKPKYPSYAVLLIRVSSFHGWPSGNGQEPKSLALAGFFYAVNSYSDYCRCFFCGGGLRNWDHGDDPWVEHGHCFAFYVLLTG